MRRLLCLLVAASMPSLAAVQAWSHSYTYTGGYPGTISTALTGCATHQATFVVVAILSPYVLASNVTISSTSISSITNANETVNSTIRGSLWYGYSASISDAETVTATASGGFASSAIWAQCYSGVATASQLDQQNTGHVGDGGSSIPDSMQPGAVTPAQSGELIVAIGLGVGGTAAVDSGFSVVDSNGSGPFGTAIASLVQSSAGSVNPTLSGSVGSGYYQLAAAIASFKAAPSTAHVMAFPILM
jgi:hypothetical protein